MYRLLEIHVHNIKNKDNNKINNRKFSNKIKINKNKINLQMIKIKSRKKILELNQLKRKEREEL
jgi:hypothetical protein